MRKQHVQPDPTSKAQRARIRVATLAAVDQAQRALLGQLGGGHDDDHDTLAALSDLATLAESAAHAYVEVMRDDGATWAMIGGSLNVTRQAAQQRFGRKLAAVQAGPGLFDLPGAADAPEPALSGYCSQRQHRRCPGHSHGQPCICDCHDAA